EETAEGQGGESGRRPGREGEEAEGFGERLRAQPGVGREESRQRAGDRQPRSLDSRPAAARPEHEKSQGDRGRERRRSGHGERGGQGQEEDRDEADGPDPRRGESRQRGN